jgi:hypothetical protein
VGSFVSSGSLSVCGVGSGDGSNLWEDLGFGIWDLGLGLSIRRSVRLWTVLKVCRIV